MWFAVVVVVVVVVVVAVVDTITKEWLSAFNAHCGTSALVLTEGTFTAVGTWAESIFLQ